jgi:N-dimethylarginine dimethylaminohydrolase
MTKNYGSQSMVTPLQTVLVKRPDLTFGNADPVTWHYTEQPYLPLARQEHDAFVNILHHSGIEVVYHDIELPHHADAIYVHDPAIVTDQGAIILSMGKELRRGEEEAMASVFEKLDIPIHHRLQGQARAEGGDLLWIDESTLAVGLGFRTNAEALRQLRAALPDVEVISVDLPYYEGPEACLHLMSFISIVDTDLAAVYLPLMPVPFWQFLKARGFRLVEVPDEEYLTMGPNVLALAPGKCLMLQQNRTTKQRLEAAGCEVLVYQGDEISLKAEGGPTCLTRPILRGA